jgi:glycosyltransferase involved in cell wall biosynthesis
MHIAWLGKKSPFCGNVTYGREVTNSLLDRHYQVSFLHFSAEKPSVGDWPDFYDEIPLPRLRSFQAYTIPTLKSSKVLQDKLEELKPDLVHASLPLSPLDFFLPEICEKLNLPLVATFHPPFDSKIRNLISSTQLLTYQLHAPILANYDKVIIFSTSQRDLLVKLGVPEERLAIIPNGVDTEKYCPSPSDIKTKYKIKYNADLLFVYLGRIAPEKNVESLLKAWKEADLGSKCRLLIVGDGVLTPSLKPFYGEEDGIIWLGFIADESERIEILQGVDGFILPSLAEGLSISLLEAMACGKACIATEAGADGEVLKGAGIILETKGVTTQLKTHLINLCDHPDFIEQYGKKARIRVLERYTLSKNIEHLEVVYQEVLSNQLSYSH